MTYSDTASGGVKLGGKGRVPDPIVVITSIDRVDVATFKLSFRSQRVPPVSFRVFREGRLLQSITSQSGTGQVFLPVGSGESPFVEILDSPSLRPHPAYSGRLSLHWRRIANAVRYVVQENVSGVWTDRFTFLEAGQGNAIFLTRWLEDVTTHQFRVVPYDAGGASGTPLSFSALMVRHPDVPNVSFDYDAGTGKVTISAV